MASLGNVSAEDFVRIEHFKESSQLSHLPGRQLEIIRSEAPAFQGWFRSKGPVSGVLTCDLIGLPYPRKFGLWRASLSPSPFLRITNRMMIVQFSFEHDTGLGSGPKRVHTLLVEPTEFELAARTPYFSKMASRIPAKVQSRIVRTHRSLQEHLARANLEPKDVDFITFDHLHTQDLRPWLGTTEPQPDLEELGKSTPGEPVEPYLPNARLLVMHQEWEQINALHPLQVPWYQPNTFRHLRTDNVIQLYGDTYLGHGVALLHTPGHSPGNHTVVLNTDSGIWTQSENGIHAECYTPEMSKMPGLARYAKSYSQEVILNANTPEFTALQYNSMVKEKLVADRGGPGGNWVQHFSSSELTPWNGAPMTSPSFVYSGITHGKILSSAQLAETE